LDLEAGLCENPHYDYATRLGQLAPVDVQLLNPQEESAWLVYLQRCVANGQRAGNVKPAALDAWTGWPNELRRLCYAPAQR
jgi:hypothetical protein